MQTARPQRRIGRLSEIGRVATRHGFGYLIDRRRGNDATQLADRGRRLREMLDELGPTFVKFGQHGLLCYTFYQGTSYEQIP